MASQRRVSDALHIPDFSEVASSSQSEGGGSSSSSSSPSPLKHGAACHFCGLRSPTMSVCALCETAVYCSALCSMDHRRFGFHTQCHS